MNAYKNKKLQKFLLLSTLVSCSYIFSPTQNSSALMRFLRGLRGGLNFNFTKTSRSSTTVPGLSNQQGKFTPLTPTSNIPQKTALKINPKTQNDNKNVKIKASSKSVIKIQSKIITTQSNIDFNKDYKDILETRIKSSNNSSARQLLYLDLMNTGTKIGNLEHQQSKLQYKLNKIQNNN